MKSRSLAPASGIFCFLFLLSFTLYVGPALALGQGSGCTDSALALAEGQLTDTIAYTNSSQFPVTTNPANGNKWNLADASQWTSGFFPGWIWYMYENTLSDSWMSRAQAQTASMLNQEANAADHDILR